MRETMYVDIDTIIRISALISALGVLLGVLYTIFKFVARQKEQDKEIKASQEERALLVWGLSACLDGLIQLGANHTVPKAKDELDKYINKSAHRMEG